MAIELGTAYVSILPDTSKLAPDVSKALGGVEKEAGKAGDKAGNSFGAGFTKKLKTVGLAAGTALIGGVGYTLFKGFERLDSLDQAEAKLRGLGHSAEVVDGVMDNALASVKGTAFGLGDAAEVAATAIAAGVQPGEDLERTLKLVGDAATIAGTDLGEMGSIFNKVAANNKVTGEVIAQLQDRGIPALQLLAEQMGVTTEEASKMVSSGEIDFATFQAAMENGLGGAALESGNTFSGAMDNMKAAVGRLGEALLKPFFGGGVGLLGDLTSLVDTISAKAGPAVERLAAWLSGTLVPALVDTGKWIKDNRDWIEPLAVAVGAAAAVYGLWTGAIKAWTTATTIATAAQNLFNKAVKANKIMLIVMAIAAVVAGLTWFFTQTELGQAIWSKFMGVLGKVGSFFKDIIDFGKMIIDILFKGQFNGDAPFGLEEDSGIVSFFFNMRDAAITLGNAIKTAWTGFIKPALDGLWTAIQFVGAIFGTIVLGTIMVAWNLFSAYFSFLWNSVIKPIWDAFAFIVTWLWTSVLMPVWEAMKVAFAALGTFFQFIWNSIIKPAWDALGAGIAFVWNAIIRPAWDALKIALGAVGTFFQWVWTAIIQPAWNALGAGIAFVWNTIILPAWNAMKAALGAVGSFFQMIWNSVIKPAWDALGNGIRFVIDTIIRPAFDALKGALDSVGSFFRTVVDGIRSAWDAMKGHVARPINFVIDAVWNNGLVRAWNTIADFLPGLPRASTLSPVAFREGGAVFGPGTGTSDSILARLSRGEHVLTAAEVKALGGQQQVYAMREMIRKGVWPMGHGADAMPKFRDGGAVGAVPGTRLSPSPGEGGLQDIGKLAKRLIHLIWPSITTIGGYRQDAYPEHPSGRALDVMVGVGNPIGDEVTGWALANDPVLPVQHVIWKQALWYPNGSTQGMGDRGSPTQNHMDHPHIWYKPKAIDPNVVPEGLVGADGLSREDRMGLIKEKISEILDKMMDPLIEGMTGIIGSPPPEWLGIMPRVATKSKDGAVDAAFGFVEKIGDDLRDVYNAAREVKDIVVSKVTGLWRDNGGFVPTGQSVVTNETGKPEAILNWDQLQQILRLLESAGGLAAIHRWSMGDTEAARRQGVDQSTIDSIGQMNLQLAEHLAGVMQSAQAKFFTSTTDGILDFFGLSGLVKGVKEVWDAFNPAKEATTAAATVSTGSPAGTSGAAGYTLENSTVPLKDMPNLDDNKSPGAGPVVDQVKEAMAPFGWDKGAQWNAVDFIVSHESSWNPLAQNPTSSAFGLFQFLDSTWASVGAVKTENPKLQGIAGRDYMKQRYGDAVGAERFWRANRWYDHGGWLDTGLTLVRNNTGTPEPVLNPSQWGIISRQTEAVADLVNGSNRRGGAPLVVIENLHAKDEDEAMRSAMREARRASRSNALIGGW